METKEILEKFAPEFVALDDAERKSYPAPWKMDNSGWIFEGKPAIKFEVQSRDGAFHNADGKFVYEAKWSTRALLDAHAQALGKLEKAREALEDCADAGYDRASDCLVEIE